LDSGALGALTRASRLAKTRFASRAIFEILSRFALPNKKNFYYLLIYDILEMRPQVMIPFFNGRLWTTLRNHCGRTKGGHLNFN
jgi:hypothetical protein